MEDTQKTFVCPVEGCIMRFASEEHLSLHKRKHDMVLNLENGQKTNIFVADQTPTPTRFIRNCEEVGLFQDLQNVNPFEETFRKAVEASRIGGSHLEFSGLIDHGPMDFYLNPLARSPSAQKTILIIWTQAIQVDPLHLPAADDTLHTPHVFPNITEEHNTIASLISSTSVTVEGENGGKTPSREELESLQVSSILQSESSITEDRTTSDLDANLEISDLEHTEVLVVKEEVDTSQQMSSRASSVDSGSKIPLSTFSSRDTVQVVIRIPDGRLVQLSGVSMDSIPSTQVQVPPTAVQTASLPQTSASSAVLFNTQFVQTAASLTEGTEQHTTGTEQNTVADTSSGIPVSSSPKSDNMITSSARLIAAKMKLKQRIQFNSKKKEVLPSEAETALISPKKEKGSAMRTLRAPSSEGSDSNSASPKGKRILNSSADVDEQKLRFRERNRAAAMRCREKRKHWILELEKRADDTQKINQQLTAEVTRLRSELMQLKTLLLAHKDCPVTRALQQGGCIAISKDKTSPVSQVQIQSSTLPISQMPVAVPGSVNVCASPEDPHPKVVLLSKPAGLKRRRPAALAAGLTIVENGSLHTNDSPVNDSQNASHVVTVSQPISIATAITDSSQICSSSQENPKSSESGPVTTQQTCLIAMTAPALISAGIPTQGIAFKTSSLTSTSYVVPTKLCLPNDSAIPQVIKFNTNNLKTVTCESMKTSSVTHASGDSMDSGHGSDIEILAEIPGKPEVKS